MSSPVEIIVRKTSRALTLLASLLFPRVVAAQNCSLCYTQAADRVTDWCRALRSGIVILVVPPMLICIGIAVMAYRKSGINSTRSSSSFLRSIRRSQGKSRSSE